MKRESIDFATEIDNCQPLVKEFSKMPAVRLHISAGEIQNMTILELMKFMHNNKVRGYVYNRGNGKASAKTKKSVKEDFEPLSVRTITLGDFRDKSQKTILNSETLSELIEFDNDFVVGEGHGRVVGIIEGVNECKITIEELKAICSLQLVPPEKFLRTYQTNNYCATITLAQTFLNPHFIFCSLLKEVLDEMGNDRITKEMDKGTKSKMLAYTIYALNMASKGYRFHNFAEVYDLRRTVKSLSTKTRDETNIRLTRGAKDRLIEALKYWDTYYGHLCYLEKTSGVNDLCKIYSREGWFGAVICDRIFGGDEKLFHRSPKLLAEASLAHVSGMGGYTNSLTECKKQRLNILIEASRVIRGEIKARR